MKMLATTETRFASVYGPVVSWRYGMSLGIDPIGPVSTCSFNCAYCQLGEIEVKTKERQLFIPTEQIRADLQPFAPWEVDVITLSGSGEPTLALNLGEILSLVNSLTQRPTLVLTNATLLGDAEVRQELSQADMVSVKLDAVSPEQLRRVDKPVAGIDLPDILAGIAAFRASYQGQLGIQTMILTEWDAQGLGEYIQVMQSLAPDEIQLNVPKRPKPLKRELEGRGNHAEPSAISYPVRVLKCVSATYLGEFAREVTRSTGIPVRYNPG